MSIRLEMLETARAARKPLEGSSGAVVSFVLGSLREDGGFAGRSGESDLYYTVFGTECLRALDADVPVDRIAAYLERFGDGASLDLVHLACLARVWVALDPRRLEPPARDAILSRIESRRSRDGGYAREPDAAAGSAYDAFLALAAYQDLEREPPDPGRLAGSVKALRTRDGGYSNEPHRERGSTPATAAAVTLLRHLQEPVDRAAASWLLDRRDASGGFRAAPEAPMPDLLSTATALHALRAMGVSLFGIHESCLDFLDSLWTARGGFRGVWADPEVDCEYTYYGLLALGSLAREG